MDHFLQKTSSKVSDTINDVKSLLDFISLIPTSRSNELLSRLDEVQKSTSNKEGTSIYNQLSTLWCLEESKNEANQRHQVVDYLTSTKVKTQNEKRNDILLHATVSLARLIRDSSEEVKDVLLDWKVRHNEHESEELDTLASNMKGYIEQILEIGCEDLRTSVKEEHRLTTDLFKLSEKCKILEEERSKLHLHLNDKECKIDKEIAAMNERKAVLTEELTKALENVDLELKHLDKETSDFLSVEEEKHKDEMSSLKLVIADEKRKLECLQENNSNELKEIMDARHTLERKLSTMIQQHDIKKKNLENEIQAMYDKTKQEIHERSELEQILQLHELNNDIADKEAATLQYILDLERKADAILDSAATHLQKLFRGMRDRAMVKKLKKKSEKGKKKGKKSKAK